MTQKEFTSLLIKFEKGNCSNEEQNLLFEFYSNFQNKDRMASWDLSKKEEVRIRLLNRINKTITNNNTYQPQKTNWKLLIGVAASFIVFLTIGVLYWSTINNKIVVPKDAITLELEDGTIKIIEEDGTAKVFDKNGTIVGQQNGSQLVYEPADSQKHLAYNTLTVPYGKRFELLLSDGTKVHLNAGTSLKYPIQFLEGMIRQVFITGEAYFEVEKDTVHPFIVNTSDMNVKVLGTQFNIQAYPEDDVAQVVLVEGLVSLYDNSKKNKLKEKTLLKPNQKAIFDKKNNDIKIDPAITSIYTSWLNGEIVFRDMPFENIVKKLERHYNVTIITNNSKLSKKVFNANFGAVTLEKVLGELKEVYGISYTIDNKIITIKQSQ